MTDLASLVAVPSGPKFAIAATSGEVEAEPVSPRANPFDVEPDTAALDAFLIGFDWAALETTA